MTDTNDTPQATGDVIDDIDVEDLNNGPSEMEVLKNQATLLGVPYSPNIGLETLRKRVEDKLNDKAEEEPDPMMAATNATIAPAAPAPKAKPRGSFYTDKECQDMSVEDIKELPAKSRTRVIRVRQRLEQLALIRCQIYCNNPKKNDLRGEIITVGNKYVGTVRKMIPFGEATENGYHIAKILFDALKRRKYQKITVTKRPDGTEEVKTQLVPEYTLNVLTPLTEDELKELALRQTAAERVGLA